MKLEEIKIGESYWWNGRFHAEHDTAVEPSLVHVIRIDDTGYLPVTIVDKTGGICYVDPETLSPIPEAER